MGRQAHTRVPPPPGYFYAWIPRTQQQLFPPYDVDRTHAPASIHLAFQDRRAVCQSSPLGSSRVGSSQHWVVDQRICRATILKSEREYSFYFLMESDEDRSRPLLFRPGWSHAFRGGGPIFVPGGYAAGAQQQQPMMMQPQQPHPYTAACAHGPPYPGAQAQGKAVQVEHIRLTLG